LTMLLSDGLLIFRLCAIYAGKPRMQLFIRITLGVFYAVFVALVIVVAANSFGPYAEDIEPTSTNFGCLDPVDNSTNAGAVVAMTSIALATNAFMLVLTMVDALPTWWNSSGMSYVGNLRKLLVRDGTMYFMLNLAPLAIWAGFVVNFTGRPGILMAPLPWTCVIGPIAACRLFLNLKGYRNSVDRSEASGSSGAPVTFEEHKLQPSRQNTRSQPSGSHSMNKETFEMTSFIDEA